MNSVPELIHKQGTLIPNRIFVGGINENVSKSLLVSLNNAIIILSDFYLGIHIGMDELSIVGLS